MSGFRSFLPSLLFFLTGLFFFICIIAWMGMLSTITGSTPAMLCVSFAILALAFGAGSIIGSRIRMLHANGWHTFAVLQLVLALYACLTPFWKQALDAIYRPIHSPSLMAKAIPAFGIFLLPGLAAGWMLPILIDITSSQEHKKRAASLFGANAAGAMVGIPVAVRVLFPALGINRTIYTCAIFFIIAGFIALFNSRHSESKAETSEARSLFHPLYFLFFLTAAAFACNSILCARALIMVFGPSIYTISAVVSVLLLGLALGAISYSGRVCLTADPFQLYSLVQFRIALSTLFFIGIFMRVPFFLHRLFQAIPFSFGIFQAVVFLLMFVLLFYGAFFAGVAFPSSLHFFNDPQADIRSRVGHFYLYSTIGIAIGCLFTPFFLIPFLGIERALRIIALVHLILGMFCFRKSAPAHQQWRVLMIGAAVLAFLLFLPAWNRVILNTGFYAQQTPGFTGLRALQDTKILFYSEGINAAVGVTEVKSTRSLIINGKLEASSDRTGDIRMRLLMGHLPALVLGDFQKALLIGLSNGVTAGALADHHPLRIDCVENEKEVAQAAQYFVEENRGVFNKKNFHLILDDEREFLQHSSEQYDLIVSSPNVSTNLLTQEFFTQCEQHLRDGGVMCQSLSLVSIAPNDVQLLLRTFHSIFLHVGIWKSSNGLIVIGAKQPVSIMPAAISWQLQSTDVRQSFRLGQISVKSLEQNYIGDERKIPNDSLLNTDDLPRLAFSRPRSIFR